MGHHLEKNWERFRQNYERNENLVLDSALKSKFFGFIKAALWHCFL